MGFVRCWTGWRPFQRGCHGLVDNLCSEFFQLQLQRHSMFFCARVGNSGLSGEVSCDGPVLKQSAVKRPGRERYDATTRPGSFTSRAAWPVRSFRKGEAASGHCSTYYNSKCCIMLFDVMPYLTKLQYVAGYSISYHDTRQCNGILYCLMLFYIARLYDIIFFCIIST